VCASGAAGGPRGDGRTLRAVRNGVGGRRGGRVGLHAEAARAPGDEVRDRDEAVAGGAPEVLDHVVCTPRQHRPVNLKEAPAFRPLVRDPDLQPAQRAPRPTPGRAHLVDRVDVPDQASVRALEDRALHLPAVVEPAAALNTAHPLPLYARTRSPRSRARRGPCPRGTRPRGAPRPPRAGRTRASPRAGCAPSRSTGPSAPPRA
jgi:hypothetical protein